MWSVECGMIGYADEEFINEEFILHSTFNIAALPQPFNTQHSTFHIQHCGSAATTQHSTLNIQH